MFSKSCIFFIFLSISLASCRKSFTVVIDTSFSMREEIDVIKANIGSVLNMFSNTSNVENYILVPFNDPNVGPPFISATPDGIFTSLSTLAVSGGHECPENSLAGIQKALEVSNQNSYVFVFTDAFAKDYSKFNEVENLCRRTCSQVYIFLTGICVPSETSQDGDSDVYHSIARACSGSVFQLLEPQELRPAFRFMKEIVKVEWNGVISYEHFTDSKELTFIVDTFTTDLIIAVNGKYPSLQVLDRNGQSQDYEVIVNTRNSLVIRVMNPVAGEYKAAVRCRGFTTVNFYKRSQLPFFFGFSTKRPKSLKETSLRPIPGRANYILIVTKAPTIEINSLELHMVDESDVKILAMEEKVESKGYYTTNAFFAPDKSFRISVSGQDMSANRGFTVLTQIWKPQRSESNTGWAKPDLEIIEPLTSTVEFGNNATVVCKVIGYPKPNISWNDENGASLSSEDVLLEIPNVHLSYLTIENLDRNLTVYCNARNPEGEDSQGLELFVHRPYSFDVIRTLKDETFDYGTEGKLYCVVKAYPEANTKWYHNDTIVESSEKIELTSEYMVIKNMNIIDVGEYKCETANEVENRTYTAVVSISGLEAPEIYIQNSEIVLKPGDWTEITCSVRRGTPTPNITWKYKSNDENSFESVPEGVYADESELKIPSVKTKHRGIYRCTAENILGQEHRDVIIKIQYAPKISDNEVKTLTVREGDYITLSCDVDAVPTATVRWEMSQDDVIIPFDKRHTTDYRHAHRFQAYWKDSGHYHCIAENDIGKDEKTIKLNVLVSPYIEPPESDTVTVEEGATVRLVCNVSYTNPMPSTRWEFTDLDSTTTVLSRRVSTLNLLELTNVTRRQEGSYMCLAVNSVASDNIRIYLKIQ